jgi:hypothetical protein
MYFIITAQWNFLMLDIVCLFVKEWARIRRDEIKNDVAL